MLDLKKVEATIAMLADESAKLAAETVLNGESKWHPGAMIAAAAGAGAALAVALMAMAVFTLKLIQG